MEPAGGPNEIIGQLLPRCFSYFILPDILDENVGAEEREREREREREVEVGMYEIESWGQ